MKNTDTFAGFAHAMNSYLAGVALADLHGIALMHRPQQMAHGLGFAFIDFFDSDPRGIVPPVYTATLGSNASAMLINGHPVQLYVQLATAGNSTLVAQQLSTLPPHSILWLRKGRDAFWDVSDTRCLSTTRSEVCYGALWLRERFWRAVLSRPQRFGGGADRVARNKLHVRRHPSARLSKSYAPRTYASSSGGTLDLEGFNANASSTGSAAAGNGGPIRISVHVRRGDVYYLGPKTRLPHPHWVETATVLDMIAGVRKVLDMPLEAPAVIVDVFSEVGWLINDTVALHALAPDARVHLDSSPSATVNVMAQMAMADILVMGSSGFSFWAGIFSCGVKIGFVRERAQPLPMRFVEYASTITTKKAPFWPTAGEAFRQEWNNYWACRSNPGCRPTLCALKHLSSGFDGQGSIWTQSNLARQQLADSTAVQWRLPELVFWPDDSSARVAAPPPEPPALAELRHMCAEAKSAKTKAANAALAMVPHAQSASYAIDSCLRNAWLHNLTAFLSKRRKVPNGVISVG